MANDKLPDGASTCLLGMWSLFVTTPMYLFLAYTIAESLGDSFPTHGWVLLWCYAPAHVAGVIAATFVRLLAKAKD